MSREYGEKRFTLKQNDTKTNEVTQTWLRGKRKLNNKKRDVEGENGKLQRNKMTGIVVNCPKSLQTSYSFLKCMWFMI
jgi:hypothetical protein